MIYNFIKSCFSVANAGFQTYRFSGTEKDESATLIHCPNRKHCRILMRLFHSDSERRFACTDYKRSLRFQKEEISHFDNFISIAELIRGNIKRYLAGSVDDRSK